MTYYRYDDLRAGKVERWVAQKEIIMSKYSYDGIHQFDNHSKIAIEYRLSPRSF